jgi:hypothetical protein
MIDGFLLPVQLPSSALSHCQYAREARLPHLSLFPKNIEAFLLGATGASDEDIKENDDPHKVLAEYFNLASGHKKDIEQAHASLLSYLVRWARLLEKEESLTTPILCGTSEGGGLNISFRKAPRYLSYKEQKNLEKGKFPDRKGAKIDAWSPGGVELVFVVVDDGKHEQQGNENNVELQMVARRCDIDGDTIVKARSEQTIVRRLNEAIRIWSKVRAEIQQERNDVEK